MPRDLKKALGQSNIKVGQRSDNASLFWKLTFITLQINGASLASIAISYRKYSCHLNSDE